MAEYFSFEKSVLDRLESGDKRYDVADTKIPGLRMRVNKGGKKTYFLFRRIKRQVASITLGRYTDLTVEQARNEAKRLNSRITLGHNPLQERLEARREMTFRQLAETYYNEYAVRHTKRPQDNWKMLEFHVFPVIGNMQLREVFPERIRKLHADMGQNRGEGTANRVLRVINAIYNYGIKNGYYLMSNPCMGVTKFREYSRDRFLNKDELKSFFDALTHESPIYQDYFSMLLFTGARKSNVLQMKWADIDFFLKQWRISEKETKNRCVNIVYLSGASMDILERRKQDNSKMESPSLYVFPGSGANGHLIDPKKAFQRIKDRMEVQDIRMHDLRRTLGSYMAISGASLPTIGTALNHKSHDSTQIYARLNQDAVVGALANATMLIQESYG